MGRRRSFVSLLLLMPMLWASVDLAVAQDASICDVEPRAEGALLGLWFGDDDVREPLPTFLDDGYETFSDAEPVDAATAEEIASVTRTWVACSNAGEMAALYGLSTDRLTMAQGIAGESREEVAAQLAAEPIARSDEAAWTLGDPLDIRLLSDGRAGATWTVTGVRQPGVAYTMYVTYAEEEGGWRLDSLTLVAAPDPVAPVSGYEVVAEIPHDPDAYTQGLEFHEGRLFESTGQYGASSLREVDPATGEVLRSVDLDDAYFGEGIAVVGDRIYQLTWQEGVCLVYDLETFELLETFTYDGEGWGLEHDGERLVMSDGSSRIVFRDAETFEQTGFIDVRDGGLPVSNLNELELIDGEIWANVYRTDLVARIDPATGDVTGWIDLAGILPEEDVTQPIDVLNGIALELETGRILVTGKLWPTMFEIEVLPRVGE